MLVYQRVNSSTTSDGPGIPGIPSRRWCWATATRYRPFHWDQWGDGWSSCPAARCPSTLAPTNIERGNFLVPRNWENFWRISGSFFFFGIWRWRDCGFENLGFDHLRFWNGLRGCVLVCLMAVHWRKAIWTEHLGQSPNAAGDEYSLCFYATNNGKIWLKNIIIYDCSIHHYP